MSQIQGNSDKLIRFYPDTGFFIPVLFTLFSTGNVTALAMKSAGKTQAAGSHSS